MFVITAKFPFRPVIGYPYEKVGIRHVITKERRLLKVCSSSRCRIPQFCSRQCQVAGREFYSMVSSTNEEPSCERDECRGG